MNVLSKSNLLDKSVSPSFLDSAKKIHFIGIGGSGMCPMAEILYTKGHTVSGSDNYESDTLIRIRELGIPVEIGQKKENIKNVDLVVYSAAIKDDNPEKSEAIKREIPTVERSVMLGMITQKYNTCIAVAGTHGKTTTTAMLTQVLVTGGKDPTSVIGGKFPFIEGNSRIGNKELIVCEACEYVDSFLELYPSVAVILNVDSDHLDYFKTLENIIKSFNKFASQTKAAIIINGDDKNAMKAVEGVNCKVITYGLSKTNNYYAENVSEENSVYESFTLMKEGKELLKVNLSVPGKHNIYNALAAAVTSFYLGTDQESIQEGLRKFKGVHRRFEVLGVKNGITVIDDFAHHPTEIQSTLSTAMSMGFRKVYAIFQPHTYSRTSVFLDDFANALSIADEVVLSDILAVREENTYNIYSEDLAAKINNCKLRKTFPEIVDYVTSVAKEGDLLITLGGGNIYKCANMIVDKLSGEK